MSKYRRFYVPGGCYFFTLVCWRRQPLLGRAEYVALLREALRGVMDERPFRIDAMVVLPDHLHCIWQLPVADADFSNRWREVKKRVTRAAGTSDFWQPRFWEHALRDENDWRRHVDYIHYNPVRHGLVNRPRDWPHSSFHQAVLRGWRESDWGEAAPPDIQAMDFE